MAKLVCTLSWKEDNSLFEDLDQVLYFYDDGTYNGIRDHNITTDKWSVDMKIFQYWRVSEVGVMQYNNSTTCSDSGWHDFKTSGELLLTKITEHYLLKSDTK